MTDQQARRQRLDEIREYLTNHGEADDIDLFLLTELDAAEARAQQVEEWHYDALDQYKAAKAETASVRSQLEQAERTVNTLQATLGVNRVATEALQAEASSLRTQLSEAREAAFKAGFAAGLNALDKFGEQLETSDEAWAALSASTPRETQA